MEKRVQKLSYLYLLLSAFFITNALIAEFGGVKIFSLQKLFNLPISGFSFLNLDFEFNMSVGVLIWPLVFIFSDIINEYFGKEGVRRISFITAGMIAYSFLIVLLWTEMPPADFWLNINNLDNQSRPFDVNYAYSFIFRTGLGIIIGSLAAFLVSQLVDAYVFQWLRKLTGHRKLWIRATGSTVVSQLIDSFVILTIAFNLLGNWSMAQVIKVGLVQYSYKILLAILLTPVIYLAHSLIDKYLNSSMKQPDTNR